VSVSPGLDSVSGLDTRTDGLTDRQTDRVTIANTHLALRVVARKNKKIKFFILRPYFFAAATTGSTGMFSRLNRGKFRVDGRKSARGESEGQASGAELVSSVGGACVLAPLPTRDRRHQRRAPRHLVSVPRYVFQPGLY